LRLDPKSSAHLLISKEFWEQNFNRDWAFEYCVYRTINGSHRATSERAENLELSDTRAFGYFHDFR
jgi:hypothetical protein